MFSKRSLVSVLHYEFLEETFMFGHKRWCMMELLHSGILKYFRDRSGRLRGGKSKFIDVAEEIDAIFETEKHRFHQCFTSVSRSSSSPRPRTFLPFNWQWCNGVEYPLSVHLLGRKIRCSMLSWVREGLRKNNRQHDKSRRKSMAICVFAQNNRKYFWW